jgi:hypothetical protein
VTSKFCYCGRGRYIYIANADLCIPPAADREETLIVKVFSFFLSERNFFLFSQQQSQVCLPGTAVIASSAKEQSFFMGFFALVAAYRDWPYIQSVQSYIAP